MAPIIPSSRVTNYAPTTPTMAFPVNFPLADDVDLAVTVNGVPRSDFTISATYPDGLSYDAVVNMNTAVTGSVVITGQRIARRQNQFMTGRPLSIPDLNTALNTQEIEIQEARRDMAANLTGLAQEIVDRTIADAALSALLDAETSARISEDEAINDRVDGIVDVVEGYTVRAEAAAENSETAAQEAEQLVEDATAGFSGFTPGLGYDFGWLINGVTYFDQDWGLITDPADDPLPGPWATVEQGAKADTAVQPGAALLAALAAAIPSLPTAPSASPSLWLNGGILTYS